MWFALTCTFEHLIGGTSTFPGVRTKRTRAFFFFTPLRFFFNRAVLLPPPLGSHGSLHEKIEAAGLTPRALVASRPPHLKYVTSYAEAYLEGESEQSAYCPTDDDDDDDDDDGDGDGGEAGEDAVRHPPQARAAAFAASAAKGAGKAAGAGRGGAAGPGGGGLAGLMKKLGRKKVRGGHGRDAAAAGGDSDDSSSGFD
jgi:hypothetical protein